MFEDTLTPRARHWAVPFMIGAVLAMLAWALFQGTVLGLAMYACAAGFGFWSLVNFVHHAGFAIISMLRENRDLDFRLSENYFAQLVADMNSDQLRAIRTGRHVIEVIPGSKGPVEKLWGVEVYLYTAWYILTMSTKDNVYPIHNFKSQTFHFDAMNTHAVDDYTQAKSFHVWLVNYGYAYWGRGNQSASWRHPHGPDEVLACLGMDRSTYREEKDTE